MMFIFVNASISVSHGPNETWAKFNDMSLHYDIYHTRHTEFHIQSTHTTYSIYIQILLYIYVHSPALSINDNIKRLDMRHSQTNIEN